MLRALTAGRGGIGWNGGQIACTHRRILLPRRLSADQFPAEWTNLRLGPLPSAARPPEILPRRRKTLPQPAPVGWKGEPQQPPVAGVAEPRPSRPTTAAGADVSLQLALERRRHKEDRDSFLEARQGSQ